MKKLTCFLLLFASCVATAQSFEWVRQVGGPQTDWATSVKTDTAGNIYVSGFFQDIADFDPGPGISNLSSMGGNDIFVLKLDNNGNFAWVKQLGGTGNEQAQRMVLDASGNIYLTGVFSTNCDFDPGPANYVLSAFGGEDAYIAKLNPSGDLIWAKQLGGTSDEVGLGLDLDSAGNLLATGRFKGTADFDPGAGQCNLVSMGQEDIYVMKLTTAGTFRWAKSMGGNSYDLGWTLAAGPSGSAYVTGFFCTTVDFDPGPGTVNLTALGGYDIFVLKLDSSGNYGWAHSFGASITDFAYGIALDNAECVYITGDYTGTVDFDPGPGTANLTPVAYNDIFVLKLDSAGHYVWARSMGGYQGETGNALCTDGADGLFLTGCFRDVADMNPNAGQVNLTSKGYQDIFIEKLDTAGIYKWVKQLGGKKSEEGTCITVGKGGALITAGFFQDTCDFDPGAGVYNLMSFGANDFFVHKINLLMGSHELLTEDDITVFPNPGSGLFEINAGHQLPESLSVYDLTGRCILQKDPNGSGRLTVDLRASPAGIYILRLNYADGVLTRKIVKQ